MQIIFCLKESNSFSVSMHKFKEKMNKRSERPKLQPVLPHPTGRGSEQDAGVKSFLKSS